MFVERCEGMVRRSVRQKWFPPEPQETSAAVNKILKDSEENTSGRIWINVAQNPAASHSDILMHELTKVHPFLWFDVEIEMSGVGSEGKWNKIINWGAAETEKLMVLKQCSWEKNAQTKPTVKIPHSVVRWDSPLLSTSKQTIAFNYRTWHSALVFPPPDCEASVWQTREDKNR